MRYLIVFVLFFLFWAPVSHAADILNVSFSEMERLFGPDSSLTEMQQAKVWKERCEGNYVVWTGTVANVVEVWLGGVAVGFRHKKSTITSDVDVAFNKKYKDVLLGVKKGAQLRYGGRLKGRPGLLSGYQLDNGYLP